LSTGSEGAWGLWVDVALSAEAPSERTEQPRSASRPTRRRAARPLSRVPRFALTRQEASAALGISVDTFERRVQPFIKVIPCRQLVLVPPAELERWVRENARYLVGR
jgi:hypothetical protein